MRNIRLDLCYDGTRYQGWQRQPGNCNTIQGKLETALTRILDQPVEVIGSGRTDAGVHAKGQVANFHCCSNLSCEEIQKQLRMHLPDDIGILSCKEVSERFHARYGAQNKTYVYRLWCSDMPCVFQRRYIAQIDGHVELEPMKTAAKFFIGTHDFSAFCGNKQFKKSTVRTIYNLDVIRTKNEIQFRICGSGFLHHMVRIITGTLLEVGKGKRSPESIPDLFGEKRECSGFLAPAKGLCLEEVVY